MRVGPGDYLALAVSSGDKKARFYKREADGTLSTLATASSAVTLTSGTWYEGKVVIDNDPNDANLQQLRFWVDTDGDGDYADETTLITSTAVDDAWSAGYVGLYRAASSSGAIQQYDDVKIGYDNNGDGDILDAGDDIEVLDNFNSNVMSLTYDNNGNLTDDGVLRYVYDGWNRLKKAQRYADGDTTTIATYSYLPDNRRASKVVEHCGIEAVANDGGDTTVHFYYGGNPSRDREGAVGGLARWNIFETRNGSNQSTRQWVWGTQYVDEVLLMDVNGDPASSNVCDADDPNHPTGTRRYFYHQDRNWNVVGLTEYDDGVGTNGRLAERYAYTPYGEFVVTKGDAGSGELGRTLVASAVGNPFFHQGLAFDQEKGSYQNRHREYGALTQRFEQVDPIAGGPNPSRRVDRALAVLQEAARAAAAGYDAIVGWPPYRQAARAAIDHGQLAVPLSLYLYAGGRPVVSLDPAGLQPTCGSCPWPYPTCFSANVCDGQHVGIQCGGTLEQPLYCNALMWCWFGCVGCCGCY